MAAPFRVSGGESLPSGGEVAEEIAAPGSASRGTESSRLRSRSRGRELTVRALGVGLAVGAVLAAGNVYTGLKSGFIDGGALTAALLSFTFFATFKRLARVPFGPFENNVAQTAAASAAIMVYVHGLMGPMPALGMLGHHFPAWALWAWGLALAVIGLVIGATLRRRLVVDDALPFPTGTATAELIRTVHADRGSASRRTRFLIGAALAAGLFTWFRDGRPSFLPQAIYLPMAVGGVAAASLTLGLATSPLMAATGMFMGLRGAATLACAGVVAWGVMGPAVVHAGWVADGSFGSLNGWLIWPALGMMLAGALVPMALEGRTLLRTLARTLRDIRNLSGRGAVPRSADAPAGADKRLAAVAVATVVLGCGVLATLGWRVFGFHPLLTVAALLLSVVLSGICARAAGETDIAPVGSLGTLTQLMFAGAGAKGSILAGAVVAGNATETAQAMWAFKAGHTLRASTRAQLVAQLLGAVVGSLVVVPTYLLVVNAYPLGSERMPAVAAISWRATAEAMAGNLGTLPPHALPAAAIAFLLGTVLCVLQKWRPGVMVPSAIVLGIGMITPASLSVAAALGAGLMVLARRRFPGLAEGESNALAAGLLAGESIVGVAIAVLAAVGLLG
jgi:putative OPT family oligopeptide transporter